MILTMVLAMILISALAAYHQGHNHGKYNDDTNVKKQWQQQ